MQSSKENKLFRQEAIERLSSPERLDQLMEVVNPRAWLPLTTIGCLVFIAGVWSVVGRIPITVNGQGVLIRPRSVVPFQVPSEGQILTLNIKSGDTIKRGDFIGTIDQPQLKQQLLQERSKLSELLSQVKETNDLQKRGIALKRQNLVEQRAVLEENLRNFRAFGPILQRKSLDALKERRQSIQQSLTQSINLLPTIQKRLDIRTRLHRERAISEDLLLQTQQEYRETQTKISDLQAQLKDLDRQESETTAEYLKNLSSIKDTNNQIQNLDVQAAQLKQQDREQFIEKSNQIQTTKRRIAQLELELATKSKIISQYNGRVLEVAIAPGQTISPGTRIAAIETENPNDSLTSVIYLADKDGKQIKLGMSVQVTPSTVKRERYGGILGTVKNITPFPVTNQDMSAIIGNENLANSIAQNLSNSGGATVQIFADLQRDSNTDTGYKWSSSSGPQQLKISSGTTAQVKVKIGEQAPISYVIPILRSLTGVY
ncbi:NHLP bacteriocin system secretion protein [Aetokthonos hydrillicola Thurmond2011]|jgi:HlyD family secretion protein|uniref:NHLP bacteriocin system secretion protein n=2 Tax=Aetokthonos TaxID=1550243 RepID=A0AAP5M4P4_9CYAN|nr:NHLP bacteriocin system secretion protein [Aetokthonos hydrillicola]MBW4590649.1 NHLP bacteriocin system secretion protein [Aetokthonos hydrillicola CCALA 1050]MDR9895011.1 NHLP bacteriocin system secretion protein [Aetokthonos hydrillicola Thurmond2011]